MPDGSLDTSKNDPNPFFVPSVPDGDLTGWDWRPYQMFRDEKRDIAVRVDSIEGYPSPTATITIGNGSLEPKGLEVESRKLVVARNSSGELQVIVAASLRPDGTSNDIWQKLESPASPSGWSNWVRLKEPRDKGISLAVEDDGHYRLEAFVIGTSNDFWRTREDVVGSGNWSDWTPLGKPINRGIVLAVKIRNDNLLEVFAIGTGYEFFHAIQRVSPESGSWSDWEILRKPKKGISLAVERRNDNLLEVFAIDTSFDFWHIWQTGTGPLEWSDWTRLGKPKIKGQKLVVAKDKTGRLEAFAIDTSNRVWRTHQNDPSRNDWSEWETLGKSLDSYKAISLAVATNDDGRLEVFAIDMTNHFWHIWQTVPDPNNWANDWVRLGGQSDRGSTLAVERNRSGRLEAFAIAIDAAGLDPSSLEPQDIRHTLQDPITNEWSDWTSL